jgi:hypothetical protein
MRRPKASANTVCEENLVALRIQDANANSAYAERRNATDAFDDDATTELAGESGVHLRCRESPHAT